MKILLTAATKLEIQPTIEWLNKHGQTDDEIHFKIGELEVSILITGVGMVMTTYALTKILPLEKPNLVIHAGIAGALNKALNIGDVLQITQEQYGDIGIEEKNGTFVDVFQMGLQDANRPPFENGVLKNYSGDAYQFLPVAKGVTVNKVTGTTTTIAQLRQWTDADIETMENAAFFFTCLAEEQAFLSIKSISNYVEPRNKDNWDIPLAVKQLNEVLQQICMAML